MSLDGFAEAFGFAEKKQSEHHALGVVSGVSGNKATVTLDGASSTVTAPSIASVSAGDRVLCLIKGGDVYVLGAF